MPRTPRKTLFKNKWVEVSELSHKLPDGQVVPFTSVRGTGNGTIAIMPYREVKRKRTSTIQFLMRNEVVPPWLVNSSETTKKVCVTGAVDDGEVPHEAAVRELYEETGFRVAPGDLLYFGRMKLGKMFEGDFYLFAVDLTGVEREVEPPGDGTAFEDHSESIWLNGFGGVEDIVSMAIVGCMCHHEILA